MKSMSFAGVLVAVLVSAVLPAIGGCAAERGVGPEESSADVASGECRVPARYDVMFASHGGCVALPVESGSRTRGVWRPRALFTELGDRSCSYEWHGAERARVEAFRALETYVANAGGVGAANCAGADPASVTAVLYEGPPPTPAHHGCDVCQKLVFVAGNELFAMISHDTVFSHVRVTRSDGETFRLFVPGASARGALRAELPEPPLGTHWVEGPVPALD